MYDDEVKTLERKIFLKSQAIKIFQNERRLLREKLFYLKTLKIYEGLFDYDNFDSKIYGKIEALRFLTKN